MATFKEKNGKTRVGAFLANVKDVSPVVLKAIGTLTGIDQLKGLANLIEGDTVMSAENKTMALELLKMDLAEMQEVTKRWSADMTSDSWLSKNVRPMALIFLTLFMTLIMFSDSKSEWMFDVKESYISLLETLLIVVYAAYFGSRGAEKIQKMRSKR